MPTSETRKIRYQRIDKQRAFRLNFWHPCSGIAGKKQSQNGKREITNRAGPARAANAGPRGQNDESQRIANQARG